MKEKNNSVARCYAASIADFATAAHAVLGFLCAVVVGMGAAITGRAPQTFSNT